MNRDVEELRHALNQLTSTGPPMRYTVKDHVQSGIALRRKRRKALAVVSACLGVLVVLLGLTAERIGGTGQATPATSAEVTPTLVTFDLAPGSIADAALVEVTLAVTSEGCLIGRGPSGSDTALAFPAGYTVKGDLDRAILVAPDGTLIAQTGDTVRLGGGFRPSSALSKNRCTPSEGAFAVQMDLTKSNPVVASRGSK